MNFCRSVTLASGRTVRARTASTASTFVMLAALLAACQAKKEAAPTVGTVAVERRTITVDAQATGAIEPINVIEVKSKASGLIIKMPVEIGSQVKAGDLLVQVDTRDVKNGYAQAAADSRSAQASLDVATSQKRRSDELYKTRIITTQEYETAQLALTQAQGAVVRSSANLDLAKQRLEDATVVAPLSGTVIAKPVAVGQVITSATGAFGGGTTLLQMADLTKVRVRTLVNETDIGNVRAQQSARVTVDAYPERPFQGTVEKIEPQAVVVQSVTMFPVIVSLDNSEGFLRPGMNGEVSLLVDRRENVLAVPNDAVRSLREAANAAKLVGLNPDSVSAMVKEAQVKMGGGRDGAGGVGQPVRDTSAKPGVAMGTDGKGLGGRGAKSATTMGGGATGGRPGGATRSRSGLVFVQSASGAFEPRLVRLGASNYDYSEVLSGLKEGEKVATLAVAALQAKRDAQNDRFRSNTTVPGVQRAPAAGGGGGGGGRPPGGG